MTHRKPISTVVAAVLALVALAHFARFLLRTPVIISGWELPLWTSLAACLASAGLSWGIWREAKTFIDRRQYPRTRAVHLATLQESGAESGQATMILGRTLQMSDGGVMIETREPVAIGTEIDLELAVEARLVRAHGLVVNAEPAEDGSYSLGVKFSSLEKTA